MIRLIQWLYINIDCKKYNIYIERDYKQYLEIIILLLFLSSLLNSCWLLLKSYY